MARRRRREPTTELAAMPADLWPDLDDWGTPAEDAKSRRRSAWLEDHDLAYEYFFAGFPPIAPSSGGWRGCRPRPRSP